MEELLEKCYVCDKCCQYLHRESKNKRKSTDDEAPSSASPPTSIGEEPLCLVCMGLWQDCGRQRLHHALEKSCVPYGGISNNQFACLPNHTPTASLAGDVLVRYKLFDWITKNSPDSTPASIYLQDLKKHIYSEVKNVLEDAAKGPGHEKDSIQDEIVRREEQGSLQLHVLCVPSRAMVPLSNYVSIKTISKKRKRGRQKTFTTQGGDPRMNLEARLQSNGYDWTAQSAAENIPLPQSDNATIFLQYLIDSTQPLEYHVAVFRRPIFLFGFYTKSRRDVSQSPFMVMSAGSEPGKKHAERKGVSSVEEQICGPIEKMLGVSSLNNLPPRPRSEKQRFTNDGDSKEYSKVDNTDDSKDKDIDTNSKNPNQTGGTIYGMIKFHASGREDMDVRMLVRTHSKSCRGRPFCIQIVDALRPITDPHQIVELTSAINHTTVGCEANTMELEQLNENGKTEQFGASTIAYGQNPLGVGISPNELNMVPAKVFSSLQKDTESKVKHYGCYCWSKKELPENESSDLTSFIFGNTTFPFTIHQKTPIRVLHRRANLTRERQILRAKATRIDEHHFRLELSTSAGTYVKEFVYGDFGRSKPSISSLLGCKCNLFYLFFFLCFRLQSTRRYLQYGWFGTTACDKMLLRTRESKATCKLPQALMAVYELNQVLRKHSCVSEFFT